MSFDSRVKKNRYGFWEIIEKPSTAELGEYYSQKYYQQGFGGAIEYTADELKNISVKLDEYWYVVDKLMHCEALSSPRLLDVGCGEGHVLAYFKNKGWNVKGFDFSSNGLLSKNKDCIDQLVVGDLYSLLGEECKSGNTYDLVSLQNVLEHVLDPIKLLQTLKSLVADGGVAVITVPNDFSSTQIKALELGYINKPFWVAPPDHLNYFNIDAITEMASKTGWECLEILANFPIDWFLFHSGSNYVADNSAGKPAHFARVKIENMLHDRPVADVVAFWSSLARLGIGRNLTVFLRPK